MLFVVSLFNFLDRQLLFILAESIKRDLSLSDTQLGLLGGIAFAVVYSTAAIPLAMLADRWSAKWTLVGSLSAWSLLTATGGIAQNFVQLALSRTGVAAGEAGSTPAAHSIISALVPEDRRGLAIGVFSLGIPVGGMLGMIAGGWLNDVASWRTAMVAVGLPGLAFAMLFALTVPNVLSVRRETATLPVVTAIGQLFSHKSYLHMWFGATIAHVGIYGIYTFSAPFLIRSHGLSATQTGLWLGLVTGVVGACSVVLGGWLTDRVGHKGAERILWLPASGFGAAAPLVVVAFLAPDAVAAIILMALVYFGAVFQMAPTYAVAQKLATPQTRAMASAILLFGPAFFAGSVGPYLTGVISDALEPRFGANSLRYALCFAAIPYAWAAVHMLLAARSLQADLDRTRDDKRIRTAA